MDVSKEVAVADVLIFLEGVLDEGVGVIEDGVGESGISRRSKEEAEEERRFCLAFKEVGDVGLPSSWREERGTCWFSLPMS